MGKSLREIHNLYQELAGQRSPLLRRAREVCDLYNGDIAFPLPALDSETRAAIPNLLAQGVDELGMRVSSVTPALEIPVMGNTDLSKKRASIQRRAALGWWEHDSVDIKDRQRARWLLAYGDSPVLILPDHEQRRPTWHVRNPLTAFRAPAADASDMTPPYSVFAYHRTLGQLRNAFPERAHDLDFGVATGRYERRRKATPADVFEVLEYVDDQEHVLCVIGRSPILSTGWRSSGFTDIYAGVGKEIISASSAGGHGSLMGVELVRTKIYTGLCPAVVPGRVTLDRLGGQFDQMLGMYELQAKIAWLEVQAAMKSVFPDEWIVGRPGEVAEIVRQADGLNGEVGLINGGNYQASNPQPGQAGMRMMDYLERSQRVSGGLPTDFSGESQSNVRTGRRGDNLLSAVIDNKLAEYQQIMARSKKEELRRAFRIAKEHFGSSAHSFHVSWKGATGGVEYTPEKDFATEDASVVYAYAGADANGLVIAAGSRVGMGSMSKESFMEIDPMVRDVELERRRINIEKIDDALWAAMGQQLAEGMLALTDAARIKALVAQGEAPEAAFAKVQREAQERQASAGPVGAPDGPVEPGTPEAMPGIEQPGIGAEQPTIEPPNESQMNLTAQLRALRMPTLTVPSERPA